MTDVLGSEGVLGKALTNCWENHGQPGIIPHARDEYRFLLQTKQAIEDCRTELNSIAYQYSTVQGMREAAEKVLSRNEAIMGQWFSLYEKQRIEARERGQRT
jgi:hypothetical protein